MDLSTITPCAPEEIVRVFDRAIADYHVQDTPDTPMQNPFAAYSFEALLYEKNWIDTVQWHLEDLARDPAIAPEKALQLKRRIDKSNQARTDKVEQMEDVYAAHFKSVVARADARLNTETIGWAVDRLSILCLKIYHMKIEADRSDADDSHKARAREKLHVLYAQKKDLLQAITTLLHDIASGAVRYQLYRQMKMYNDPQLNPVLYQKRVDSHGKK